MTTFDALDRRIIEILTADARTSNREVARQTDMSEAAIRKRLKRLSQSGAATITAVVNPRALGLRTTAIVRLQTSPAVSRQVVENAASLDFVSFAALTAGRFNVVVLVSAESRTVLSQLIHERFRCQDGVHLIDTVELTETIKHRLDMVVIPRHGRAM